MTDPYNGGAEWNAIGRHVLAELKRLSKGQEDLTNSLLEIRTQLARIEGQNAWIAKVDERSLKNTAELAALKVRTTFLGGLSLVGAALGVFIVRLLGM